MLLSGWTYLITVGCSKMGGSGNLVGRVVSKLESLPQGPIPYNPTHTYPRSDVHLCSSSYTPGFKQASFRLVRLCGRLQTKRSIKLTDQSKTAPAKDLERSLSFVVFRYEASKRMSKGCRCFDDPLKHGQLRWLTAHLFTHARAARHGCSPVYTASAPGQHAAQRGSRLEKRAITASAKALRPFTWSLEEIMVVMVVKLGKIVRS